MNPLLALKKIFLGRSLLFGAFAAFIIGVFCLGLWRFHVGFLLGWDPRGSADLHERFVEYGYFLFGVYPSPGIAGDHALQGMRNSVYPPYAFPMLSLFFGTGNWLQGKVVVALTVAVSLLLMSWLGFRRLRGSGIPAALTGLILPFAMTSITGALEWGQFGFFSTGMVLLQMLLLEKGRKYAAGFCWLLAMLKPQIGLAFIGLFSFRNQWRGCLVAFGALVGLSLFACAQTDVSLQRVVYHWLFGQDLGFSFGNIAGIPFNSARLSPFLTAKFVVLVALVGASLIVYRLSLLQRIKPAHASLLELTGAYAVLGRLAFYHRPHDDVMLFPAFLASLSFAIHSRRRADWALFSAVFFSLAQPSEWVMNVPKLAVLNGFIWLVLGGRLLYSQFRAGLFKEC